MIRFAVHAACIVFVGVAVLVATITLLGGALLFGAAVFIELAARSLR